jgi:hypothetical protein
MRGILAVFVAFTVLAVALPASAQAPQVSCSRPGPRLAASPQLVAARHAMNQACAADMATFCAGVTSGCGRPAQCLAAHSAQLSASCTAARQNLRAISHPVPG